MNTISLVLFVLKLARLVLGLVDNHQIAQAEKRGEDLGVLRSFKLWSEELDRVAKAAKQAGDDVASGRVRVDADNDPFNRGKD